MKFYERVLSTVGQKNANEFVQLYVVPEMGHCGGGPVSEFGLRLQPHADSLHSMVAALQHWVEDGVAPNAIMRRNTRWTTSPPAASCEPALCALIQWTLVGPVAAAPTMRPNYVCEVVPGSR